MLRDDYITQEQLDDALKVTWGEMNPSRITSVLREPHFSFRVEREAESILAALGVANPAEAVRTGGYRITSTLDYRLQQVAHNQVRTWVNALADKNVHNGALVAIDSATGEIVAYVGSVDYYDRKDPRVQGQFDVAGLGLRQPGSAFKPIVYSSAFRAREATPATFFLDSVTQFGADRDDQLPAHQRRHQGPRSAAGGRRAALLAQRPVGDDAVPGRHQRDGPFRAVDGDRARASTSSDQDPGLSLALGSVPVNLTNMTGAYGVFAAAGRPPSADHPSWRSATGTIGSSTA